MIRQRALLGPMACGAALVALSGAPAGAAEFDPQITVTPHDGLHDGQVVRVDGTGWGEPGGTEPVFWGIEQCTSAAPDPDTCGNGMGLDPHTFSDGSYSVDYTVRRTFRNGEDDRTLTCESDCHVYAWVFTDGGGHPRSWGDTAPITFVTPK